MRCRKRIQYSESQKTQMWDRWQRRRRVARVAAFEPRSEHPAVGAIAAVRYMPAACRHSARDSGGKRLASPSAWPRSRVGHIASLL